MDKQELKPLALLTLFSLVPRLYQLNSPFVTRDDWGLAQLAVYARNHIDLGFLETQFLPVFGVVGGENITYTNHPFLVEVLNALWCMVFGLSEGAMRGFAIVWSLLTVLALYRLGRQLWDHQTGLLAAAFYAFTPMSIYMGRTPNIETPCYFFGLLGLSLAIDWDRYHQHRHLGLSCLCLGLSAWCDHYAIFLIPFLFFIALIKRSKSLVLVAAAPAAAYAAYLGYIAAISGLGDLLYGASKHASPWELWVQPDYFWNVFKGILWNYGGLPPILALWGLVRLWKSSDRQPLIWLSPLFGLFLLDLLLSAGVVAAHVFRILFVAGPLVLLAAHAIRDLTRNQKIAIALVCGALFVPPLKDNFAHTNSGDIAMAHKVRELTTDKDLLIGLPPHMAYYVNRKAIVSYAYSWVGEGVFKTPADVFQRLRPFAEHKEYDRLVLFTQFLLNPRTSLRGVDFSRTFDGIEGWTRVTEPGVDPQVWKRTPQN